MLKGSPEKQVEFLESEGYVAELEGDVIKVRKKEDKEWKVVDPKGLVTIGDALHDIVEAIPLTEIGMAVAGGGPSKAALKAAAGAVGTGAKAAGKVALNLGDRILNVSPTYKAAKSVVKGAAKAHKDIKTIAEHIRKTAPKPSTGAAPKPSSSIKDRLEGITPEAANPKKFIDPFKVRRTRK
jgi:hypothetical protein